jgi:dolichol-phosphate mannosyltransferase
MTGAPAPTGTPVEVSTARRPLISIVVPALNEEDNVEPFVTAIVAVTDTLTEYDWEIVWVDDGSTDSTAAKVAAIRERDPRVCLLQLSRNFGSYAAIRAGFDYVRGDAVIVISADLQDPPELIRSFVEHWREGYHIFWAVRAARHESWAKKTLASAFYTIIRKLALAGMPTGGMDYGLFDRRVVEVFCQIPDRNGITFMTIYWTGFRQAQILYDRRPRQRGTSKWPFGKRMRSALDVITSFSDLPIRACSYLGLATSTLSLLAAVVVLFNRLVLDIGEWGWPSLMITILFLGGVQLVMLGLIGEYIWRIGSEVRGRPQYIVMDTLGFTLQRPGATPGPAPGVTPSGMPGVAMPSTATGHAEPRSQ